MEGSKNLVQKTGILANKEKLSQKKAIAGCKRLKEKESPFWGHFHSFWRCILDFLIIFGSLFWGCIFLDFAKKIGYFLGELFLEFY